MSETDRTAIQEEARRWWSIAAEDLRVARACLGMAPPALEASAYHCQQAAEKLMKGLLVIVGTSFRKIHDLDELATITVPLHPDLATDIDLCRPFSAWATEYRYPAEDESPPPSTGEIEEALAILDRIMHSVSTIR